jgi:hypothetical protein
MRFRYPIVLALMLVSAAVAAVSVDPKALARFDNSFTKCETRFPEMKGARDEAYLGMYRVKADAKARADLAAARKGAAYQAESRRAREEDAKTPPAKDKLENQCRALWGETQRMRSLAQ